MDRNVTVTRPMLAEIPITESRVAEAVRKNDDRHVRLGGIGSIDVDRNVALTLCIEPVDVVLRDAMRPRLRQTCDRRIGDDRVSRHRCAPCESEEAERAKFSSHRNGCSKLRYKITARSPALGPTPLGNPTAGTICRPFAKLYAQRTAGLTSKEFSPSPRLKTVSTMKLIRFAGR